MNTFWNQRYSAADYAYGRDPNTFFAHALAGRRPGRILLPGEGEGRNAIHAARNGWEVHAIDFSEEGMRKTRRLAEEHGVTVEYTVADLESFVPEHQAYDMAALVFVHLSALLRRTLHHRCAEALRPGGCMLIEAFSPDQLAYGSGGPRHKELLYTTDMLAADFPSLEITLLEECIVNLREGPFHDGEAAVVRLIAEKPSDM